MALIGIANEAARIGNCSKQYKQIIFDLLNEITHQQSPELHQVK